MGPFMVEIVFCRVTRRGRKLRKGMNKAGRANMRNDGPSMSFIPPEDTVKVTLDLSEGGPVFSAMDEMMMKMLDDDAKDRKKGKGSEAKDSLKRLLKSGIPGVEKMFAGPADPAGGGKGGKAPAKGFHKMNDGSKKKFMTAIFGEDGTSVDTNTAAALLVATCAGGDPTIADNIAKLVVPDLGATVDPAMMAALMASCSMINAGASTEEVLKAMKAELAASGMTEEEILLKAQVLMKAFGKEDTTSMAQYSLASAQKNNALKQINVSPKDFAQAVLVQKAIAACGATPENFAKILMIQNQLYKRGANCRDIAVSLKELGDFESKKEATHASILQAIKEEKLQKNDVFMNVRMAQALDNENDTNWKEVKGMKDILSGCSPNSPEAISLNLARATKTGGLNKHDIAACLTAQKVMVVLGVDPKILAQITNIEKVIAQNGVPAVEIARVLQDGSMPAEVIEALASLAEPELGKTINDKDVDMFCKVYDNLKMKANIPEDVIEFIDKKLIQVRCSLEDVADNMVGTKLAMGAKENVVVRDLCETLRKTGASAEITCTTMQGALKKVVSKSDCDIMKLVGQAAVEDGNFQNEDITKAMTEVMLNILEEDISAREEAAKAMETIMKDAGMFPTEIREYLENVMPPEERPPSPRLLAELERLREEEEAREAEKERKALEGSSSSGEDFVDDGKGAGKPKNKLLDAVGSDSRRGSLVPPGSRRGSRQGSISLAGTERRGSYYGDDVSKRATVAVVVDGDKARSPSPPRRRVQRKEAKVEEWNCVAKDDFFKADEKALAAAEKKKKEAEEEAKRIEEASNSTVSISVLRKKDQSKKVADINDTASLSVNGTDASDDRVSWKEKIEKDLEKERKAKQDEKQNRGNMVTVMGADGKPMQVNSNALQQGGIPNGNGNMVTVMSPDGKPIQVNASALQSAGSQNNIGNTVTVMSPDGTPVQVNNNVLQQAVAQGSAGNTVTIMSPEGKPIEVNASALQAASSQNAVGNTVTIMSPDGKPVQVNASALQAAGAQNTMGNTVTVMSPDGKPIQVDSSTLQSLASDNTSGNMVTIMSPEGKPIQVNASALQAAAGQNTMGNTVTVMSPDGKPIQVNASALQAAAAQNPMGNMVTIMSPEGKPIQVNASALQAASAQNTMGNMVTIMSPEGKPIQVNASALQAASAQNSMGNMVTIMSPEGKPIQVNASALQAASAQNTMEQGLGPEVVDMSPEEARRALLQKIKSDGMSEDDVTKLMSVFDNQGVLSKIGGVRKYRKISDIQGTLNDTDAAFGKAIDASQRKKTPGLSNENRKLMEDILAKSVNEQQAIGSRVAALLAGTSLTTTSGVEIRRRDPVEEIGYETVDGLGKLTRRKADTYVAPKRVEIPKVTVQDIPRPSIQRQSQSLTRLRKLSEQQREADKKREEEKRITGLRRAKVPLMVYSCGGFTRCFRIARFYDVDGPPIGVTYDANSRAALNPDINTVHEES